MVLCRAVEKKEWKVLKKIKFYFICSIAYLRVVGRVFPDEQTKNSLYGSVKK